MARETKVGLIVGLGLILFVGMMVSEYFVDSPEAQELAATELSNFNGSTTNQTAPPPTRDLPGQDDVRPSREQMAAAIVESWGDNQLPGNRRIIEPERIDEPPFREMTADPLAGINETPVADRRYTPPSDPIVEIGGSFDERRLARGNQIRPERLGPGAEPVIDVAHVEIPEPEETIAIQPRQVFHVVAAGETLTAIARKHYDGDGNMWYSIRDANPGKVGPNGKVIEGARLVIPRRSVEAEDPAGQLSAREPGDNRRPARQRVRMITVKQGQTLSEIAAEHLGSGRKWPEIMKVNDDVLEKPEQLRAGMKLRIPADDPIEEAAEEANAALRDRQAESVDEPNSEERARVYTVKSGDNLSLIAGRELGNSSRYLEIFKANRDKLRTADDIKVGMTLVLPAR